MCVLVTLRKSGKPFTGSEGNMVKIIVSRRTLYILGTFRNFIILEHKI